MRQFLEEMQITLALRRGFKNFPHFINKDDQSRVLRTLSYFGQGIE